MKSLIRTITAAIITLFCHLTAHSQGNAPLSATIDKQVKNEVIDNLLKQLNDNYVFPEVAKEAEKKIRRYQKEGVYSKITDAKIFEETLNTQLRELVNDKHLNVRYNSKMIANNAVPDSIARQKFALEWENSLKRNNFGFTRSDILEGNIGYLKVNSFGPVDKVAKTCNAAMAFLNNTNALIIDLRDNHGGDPAMVQYLASYFFGDEPVHLNSLYFRPANRTDDFWTIPVEGSKYLNKPVYILTSGKTFSGGEEFAYDLQQLKRGITVGETTGGGANPGDRVPLGHGFNAFIPTGRAINPITKTNWEGIGVKPDVATTAANALKEAHILALKEVMKNTADAEEKAYFERHLQQLQK
jgi:C-terminal processing protease CtpA/Prc